jgi:uncharacterized protein YyaL (SSP411 family)
MCVSAWSVNSKIIDNANANIKIKIITHMCEPALGQADASVGGVGVQEKYPKTTCQMFLFHSYRRFWRGRPKFIP